MFLMIVFILLYACDIVTMEITNPVPISQKVEKPESPVQMGCIRGYFGNEYKIFTQHIEKVAVIDSFSNCYFYGSGSNNLKQINLIRCDSIFVLAIYIMGFSPDSLPATLPVPPEFCKFAEIQFYTFQDWNNVSTDIKNSRYILNDFYGKSVFIINNTNDVLTGTFEGNLISPSGKTMRVSEGEFKIKIFRKYMPSGQENGK